MSKVYQNKEVKTSPKQKALGANRDLLRQVFAESLLEQLQQTASGVIPLALLNTPKGVLARGINDLMRSNAIEVNSTNGNCVITLKSNKPTKSNKNNGGNA